MAPASVAERIKAGRDARKRVPRSGNSHFEVGADRPDPVDLLESQAETRVPELVPVRYGRMAVSPFTFYRGAALVMASDLSATASSDFQVQCCGDAHLLNFGGFGTPERNLVFDVNDFDETLPGPWEWDVKRLVASIEIAGRELGFAARDRRRATVTVGRSYRESMAVFASRRQLEVWYQHLDLNELITSFGAQLSPEMRRRVERQATRARFSDSMKALDKLTAVVDGERRIVADHPLVVPIEDLAHVEAEYLLSATARLVEDYSRSLPSNNRHLLEQYRMVHLARKVVGVGSVGTRCWIVLMVGRDEDDVLFLQAKEAQPSVLSAYVGASKYSNQGERVVAGQLMMQASSDIFLGWERAQGIDGQMRDFYVRQLRDWKVSANVERMDPNAMTGYARMCGWTLARGHARSGDSVAIAAYLGRSVTFDEALADFAESYADQNERDYATFKAAIDAGRITATMGV